MIRVHGPDSSQPYDLPVPARTNTWQKAVCALARFLEPGYVVEESKDVEELSSGRKREVDVVIEAKVLDLTHTTSIECIDWRRPADVGWVERMGAKHAKLPTNMLILASRSGFYRPASDLAEEINAITFTAGDVDPAFEGKIANRLATALLR